ncbi:MAG: ribonuclease P protein component 1 [Methanobrevibacter sp.]|jgi:ribonuclease P protein subunit POP4|nr:ribonuclease P protein component 1 [Candidatus Methanovirga meridionalis]MDR3291647.1 ribonuclease P protein component 1 [Methanobrevibacter sp.]
MITSKNIFRHELIGLYLEVVDSSNKSLIGLCGNVVDETKKTLSIDVSYNKIRNDLNQNSILISQKMIPKKNSTFHFKIPNGKWVEIEGKILVSSPEDRIKKKFKKI